MARHFLAITLICTGVIITSPAGAVTAARCEDRAANCVGGCLNPNGGWYQNKCMRYCERHVTSCLIRAHGAGLRAGVSFQRETRLVTACSIVPVKRPSLYSKSTT
jgi:hypothetical protein